YLPDDLQEPEAAHRGPGAAGAYDDPYAVAAEYNRRSQLHPQLQIHEVLQAQAQAQRSAAAALESAARAVTARAAQVAAARAPPPPPPPPPPASAPVAVPVPRGRRILEIRDPTTGTSLTSELEAARARAGAAGAAGSVEAEPAAALRVNPTQVEALTMVCCQVMGNHTAVTVAGASGHFQLNAFKPLIASALLRSIALLADACASFTTNLVEGLRADGKVLKRYVEQSLMLATALNPVIALRAS
ncbi:Fumarate hydratase 2, chloroplastic, partial [Tetrabaena socialis]